MDYLRDTDRSEAIEFTLAVLRSALGCQDVRLYPVSARAALEATMRGDAEALKASGLAEFGRDFRRFLLHEKGATIIASAAARARKLLVDERNSLEVEERTHTLLRGESKSS